MVIIPWRGLFDQAADVEVIGTKAIKQPSFLRILPKFLDSTIPDI
jgi:hypothetical protein